MGAGRSGVANLGPSPFGTPQLHVLMLPDFDRADRIGAYLATPGICVERGEAQACRYRGDPFSTKEMIASAAIITAMMMMIPMLIAAIIRPLLATISPRLACAKP